LGEEGILGVSISLLFVRGQTAEKTLNALQMVATGERRDEPLVQRGTFAMTDLLSGFHMVWSNTCDERRFAKPVLAKLSEGGEVVLESFEEHVMMSHVEYWRDGTRQWSVSHFGDEDDKHLQADGTPPELFEALRQEQVSRGDDGDFFEIAVRMGDELTGFRYDRTPDLEKGAGWALLASTAPAKKPFWKFW
jgi:hypothetical protein